jgi:transcriptional regulator with XRE-family HTH domain
MASGVTQAEVAARMRTPAPVLSRLTNARTPNPTFTTFGKALKAVGLAATNKIKKRARVNRRSEWSVSSSSRRSTFQR